MGERWIKEAVDLKAAGSSGTMLGNHNRPKVTWHVTVSNPGSFDAMHRVLTSKKSEPHLLYDPKGDRLGQYFALDRGARALGNDGATPTNRDGTINIQIEVCAQAGDIRKGIAGFTEHPDFDPTAPNWRALMRAIRSWGIPDEWPGDIARGSWATDSVPRSWTTYRLAGHHGHCEVPGNSHWDPGNITIPRLFATETAKPATPTTAPAPAPVDSLRETWLRKQIAEHGVWKDGGAFIKRVQAEYGATIDGYEGEETWRAVQKWVGVTQDGVRGPATVRGLQRKLGFTNLTGNWSPYLRVQWQRHLNDLSKARRMS